MTRAPLELLDKAWEALERGHFRRARFLATRAGRDARHKAEAHHVLGATALGEALEMLERAEEQVRKLGLA